VIQRLNARYVADDGPPEVPSIFLYPGLSDRLVYASFLELVALVCPFSLDNLRLEPLEQKNQEETPF